MLAPPTKAKSTTVPYSQQALINDVERLHDAWVVCRENRARDAIYRFLIAVYDLVRLWSAYGKVQTRVRRALRVRGLDTSHSVEPFAALLKAAVHPKTLDRRTVSKWSRVLRYAKAVKLPSDSLKDFIKREGGINACASCYSQRLRHSSDL